MSILSHQVESRRNTSTSSIHQGASAHNVLVAHVNPGLQNQGNMFELLRDMKAKLMSQNDKVTAEVSLDRPK